MPNCNVCRKPIPKRHQLDTNLCLVCIDTVASEAERIEKRLEALDEVIQKGDRLFNQAEIKELCCIGLVKRWIYDVARPRAKQQNK